MIGNPVGKCCPCEQGLAGGKKRLRRCHGPSKKLVDTVMSIVLQTMVGGVAMVWREAGDASELTRSRVSALLSGVSRSRGWTCNRLRNIVHLIPPLLLTLVRSISPMRRISAHPLRQRLLAPRRLLSLSPAPARTLQTTSAISFPRSPTPRRTFAAASSPSEPPHNAPEQPPLPPDDAPAPLEQEPHHPPSTGRDLLAYATEVIPPSTPAGAFPQDLQPVLTHLSTAFLPRNQHLATDPVSSPFTHVISFPPGAHGRAQTDPSREEEDSEPAPENVIALASPFEGGDIYVKEAVQTLANKMEADVVRLDLVMGLALDGMAAPLGVCK